MHSQATQEERVHAWKEVRNFSSMMNWNAATTWAPTTKQSPSSTALTASGWPCRTQVVSRPVWAEPEEQHAAACPHLQQLGDSPSHIVHDLIPRLLHVAPVLWV